MIIKSLLFKILLLELLFTYSIYAKCPKASSISKYAKEIKSYQSFADLKRNKKSLKNLCIYQISFNENNLQWRMLLLINSQKPKGAFWYIPHDDENSAFDSAIYAIKRYGGGFLAVQSGGKRFFGYQDPNRNFGKDKKTASMCKGQKYPAPIYTDTVFNIIDKFRSWGMPYLALHNNSNGYSGNGGKGTISILHSTSHTKSFPAYKKITRTNGGLSDEDSLVYIAGNSKNPPMSKINRLRSLGLNVKYEWVDKNHYDCSMSNYVVLKKGTDRYFNIETQKGDIKTQKLMIDRLMRIIY